MQGEMVAALRKKRMEGMGKVAEPVEALEAEAAPAPEELLGMIQDMDAKIDQILGLLQPEEGPEVAEEV